MVDTKKIARLCKILSVEARVKIVSLLKNKRLCVGALTHHLGITQAAVSQHLRVLKDCELLIAEKRGFFVHYQLNEPALIEWGDALRELLDAGEKKSGCCRREGGAS
jgi:DNA-binding transcriptional ArsR family regulator